MEADEELVRRALDGDLGSFDELMRRYERLVVKVSLDFGESREDALDIAQSAFLAAYRRLGSFQHRGSFKGWLLRIVHHQGLNWVRGQRRHRRGRIAGIEADSLPAPGTGPHDDFRAGERRRDLARAMGRLPGRHRLALDLRYLGEMSIREVACALRCSEGAAKNLLFRALRRLRSEMEAGRDRQ